MGNATQRIKHHGTTAQQNAYTGPLAELTVDTDKKTVVVQDGSAAGGFPLAQEAALLTMSRTAYVSLSFTSDSTKQKFGSAADAIAWINALDPAPAAAHPAWIIDDGSIDWHTTTLPVGVFLFRPQSAGGFVNIQTGTTYAITADDDGTLIVFNNATGVAVSVPNANTLDSRFKPKWTNIGAGAVTFTPTGCTIDGDTTLVSNQFEGGELFGNGTNYYTIRGAIGLNLAQGI